MEHDDAARMSGPHPSCPYVNIDELDRNSILHVATGVSLGFEQLVGVIADNRALYIGENHDNQAAHDVQLRLIEALHARQDGKIVIGMEMFRCDVQEQLDGLVTGALSKDAFNHLFDQQWTATWRPLYQGILDFIYDNRVPLVGLKPPRTVEDVVREGGRNDDTPDLDLDDAHHRAHYMPFFQNRRDPAKAERGYRIMSLWDEAMADNAARTLSNPACKDRMLIVIAGNGHINYGFGIPKRCFRRVPHSYATLLPINEHDRDNAANLALADFIWKVSY